MAPHTPDLVRMVTEETDMQRNPLKYEKWKGFNILMGINSLPSLDDYWRNIVLLRIRLAGTGSPRYADTSTLAPPGSPVYDCLGKVRPVLDYLHARFTSVYAPGQELAVDEAMIKFQGRSSLKQYLPKKPIKF